METAATMEALQAKYERRLGRERRARNEAEDLLEAKSRELYDANQRLQSLAEQLEQRVTDRTRELALAQRQALALAERDQLTGIANRMIFARRIEEAIHEGHVGRRGFALLLIDLDNFKHVNDGFGHDVGDALLRHAADRIAAAIRRPDCVARLGGDEFATILVDCTCPADLAAIAARIITFVREPLRHRGHVVEASCSIGIAIYPDHATEAAELQRFADLALYKAKAAGRTTFAIFDDQLRREYDDRHAIGSDLKLAIEAGDVQPWFQPIVDARTSKLVGVEALARWRHPTRGLLPPATFLGIAEERGLTNELFVGMLRQTCRRTLDWVATGFINYVSVNVSPSQFHSGHLAEAIDMIVRAEDFPPSALTVEITEEVLLNDLGSARVQLEAVTRLGVSIALDDFGVGYSNIGYLRRLPLHQLKLDRILTADITEDFKARTILAAIIEIARTLDLGVVAEGIETAPQAEWLSHLGCDKLQGFYFGKAMEHDEFKRKFQHQPTDPARLAKRKPVPPETTFGRGLALRPEDVSASTPALMTPASGSRGI